MPPGDLAVVPTGFLTLLPIAAALQDADEVRAISVITTLNRRPASDIEPSTHVLTVSDPSLPWARWETAVVETFLVPATTTDANAAPAEIIAAFPPRGVVHFACHGRVNLDQPLSSCLELPGGELTVGNLLSAHCPPLSMVVLSACETGLPDPQRLDEGLAFPGVFLASTGASVVSTLWQVSDLSTSLLILRFYWEWQRDQSRCALALALAQQWQRETSTAQKCEFLIEAAGAGKVTDEAAAAMSKAIREHSRSAEDNPFSHPYHWAGFTCAS